MRKRFISLGFCLAMAGLLFMLFSGCRDKAKSVSWDTKPDFEPAYLKLHRTGELKKRGEKLWNIMQSCKLCPRMCGVNRLKGEKGFCGATSQLVITDRPSPGFSPRVVKVCRSEASF